METLLPFLVVGISVGAVYALSGVGLVVLYRASGVVNFAFADGSVRSLKAGIDLNMFRGLMGMADGGTFVD